MTDLTDLMPGKRKSGGKKSDIRTSGNFRRGPEKRPSSASSPSSRSFFEQEALSVHFNGLDELDGLDGLDARTESFIQPSRAIGSMYRSELDELDALDGARAGSGARTAGGRRAQMRGGRGRAGHR